MSQGFYGFPNILGVLRATTFQAVGKIGATAGAALAGATTSGAPTSGGPFDVGDVIVSRSDGSLWICTTAGTSQSSPGSFTQVGTLVDPLTTRGDLIVRGASSTTRLALGASGYVLQSNGTDALWATSPANAGGALTQIAQTILSGSASSIAFSSIPGTYSNLLLRFVGRSDSASTALALNVQLNSDSGSNYMYHRRYSDNTSTGASNSTGDTQYIAGYISGASSPTSRASEIELHLADYARTAWHKPLRSHNNLELDNTNPVVQVAMIAGVWKSTAAVTAITLTTTGNFVTNTVATLYGLS